MLFSYSCPNLFPHCSPLPKIFNFLNCFKRERKGERKGGRETSIQERSTCWWTPICSLTRTQSAAQACALTGNQTHNLSVTSWCFNHMSHTGESGFDIYDTIILGKSLVCSELQFPQPYIEMVIHLLDDGRIRAQVANIRPAGRTRPSTLFYPAGASFLPGSSAELSLNC